MGEQTLEQKIKSECEHNLYIVLKDVLPSEVILDDDREDDEDEEDNED